MESIIPVKQIGSTVINFLMIPAAFGAVIYLTKIIDGMNKTPSEFQTEAFVGVVLSFFLACYSYKKQHNSSFIVNRLPLGANYAHSITVDNLQKEPVSMKLTIILNGEVKYLSANLESFEQKNLSSEVHGLIQSENNNKSLPANIKFEFNTSAKDIVINVMSYEKANAQKSDVTVKSNGMA